MHTNVHPIEELERAVGQYKRLVYGIALHELNTRADADDVFQEVFLLYFRKGEVFPNEDAERAWFVRAALNYCRRYNTSVWNTRVDKLAPEDFGAIEDIWSDDPSGMEKTVFSALKSLPEKYRVPVYLYYFENIPAAEIGRLLQLKESTVLSRLHRARKKLRKELEGVFDER